MVKPILPLPMPPPPDVTVTQVLLAEPNTIQVQFT
jgi:hypothetical protein